MFATKRIKDNGGTNRPWNWIEISITTVLFVFLYPIAFPIAFFHLETLHRPTPLITHQQIKQRREIKWILLWGSVKKKKILLWGKATAEYFENWTKFWSKKHPVYVNGQSWFWKIKVYIYFTFKMKLVTHKWNIEFILSFQRVNTILTYQL